MTPAELRRIAPELRAPLVQELSYRGLPRGVGLDAFRSDHARHIGAHVPYWAIAWPGGLALARYLLDHPWSVAGRAVIDVGCGNGLVAAAAMRAGAASALACDIDPVALVAAEETAILNGVRITTALQCFGSVAAPPGAVVCAGDLWYEPVTGRAATSALARMAGTAHAVLIADPGRPGRPRHGTVELACYRIPACPDFERADAVDARVYTLMPPDILHAHPPHASRGHVIGDGIEVKLHGSSRAQEGG